MNQFWFFVISRVRRQEQNEIQRFLWSLFHLILFLPTEIVKERQFLIRINNFMNQFKCLVVLAFCLLTSIVEAQVVKGQTIVGGNGNLRISLQTDSYGISFNPHYGKVFNKNIALGGMLKTDYSSGVNDYRSTRIGIGPFVKYFFPIGGKESKNWLALHAEAVYSSTTLTFLGDEFDNDFIEFSIGPQYYYFINNKVAFEISAFYYYTDNVPSFRDNQQDLSILFGLSVFL